MQARIFTAKEKESIAKLYQSGMWYTEIASLLHASKEKIAQELDAQGISRTRVQRVTNNQAELIVEQYQNGFTLSAISENSGISKPTIMKVLDREHVPLKSDVSKLKKEQAVKLYLEGTVPVAQICQETGVSKATLYRELKKLNN